MEILESIPQMAWTITPGCEVENCNQLWEAYTGLRIAGHGQVPAADFIHPEDLQKFHRAAEKNSTKASLVRCRIRHVSGMYLWNVIHFAPSSPSRILTATEIHEDEESLEFILESARMGTWEIDLAADQVKCSETMLRMWNVDPLKFGGDRPVLQSRVHPDDVEKMRSAINEAIANKSIYELDYRIIPKAGVLRWVNSRGRCTYDSRTGKPAKFSGVVYDITEKRLAREELSLLYSIASEFSKALTEAEVKKIVLERAGGAFFEPAERGTALDWSPALPGGLEAEISRAYLSGESRITETSATIPSQFGEKRLGVLHFNFAEAPVLSRGSGNLMATIAALCGEALARAKLYDISQKAVKARDTMLSVSAHELITPISGAKLKMQVLIKKIERGLDIRREDLLKMASQTDRELSRLGQLVDDMLDVSRINLGKLTLRRQNIDLSKTVADAVDRCQAALVSANCKTRVDTGGTVGVWADPYRLEQVVINLVSNACRYAPGSPIEITLKTPDAKTARLEIADRGNGIKKEDQERIFERFERGSSPGEKAGLGLGLFIVRQIVEAHGGRVQVESEVGQGARFIVEIPVNPEGAGG